MNVKIFTNGLDDVISRSNDVIDYVISRQNPSRTKKSSYSLNSHSFHRHKRNHPLKRPDMVILALDDVIYQPDDVIEHRVWLESFVSHWSDTELQS